MKAVSIFCLLFDSQIPAAYIRKRFNFESGLDSEKYGIYYVRMYHVRTHYVVVLL